MKTRTSLFAFIVILLATSGSVLAQSNPIPKSVWKMRGQIDFATSDTVQYDGVIKIDKDVIGWGSDVSELTELTITDAEGSWDKKTDMGSVVYNITVADAKGTVKVHGDDSSLYIEVELNFAGISTETHLIVKEIDY